MNKQATVTINGVAYDSNTGLRVDQSSNAKPAAHRTSNNAQSIHRSTDRTHTLSRSHVKAPAKHVTAVNNQPKTHHPKSPLITKFADVRVPATHASSPKPRHVSDVQPAVRHPLQEKAAHRSTALQASKLEHKQPRPASEIKQRAIEKALHNAKPAKAKRRSLISRHPRALSVATASLALVLLAGYLTYINLPSISVRVAAAQAGIAATYPSYQPSGYSLNGPVAYSNGQISMKFAANVGPQTFTINQVKSSWDSSALLDNYVQQASQGEYTTYNDSGLTVYVYGSNAAWVNGGILHTIQGKAPLSSDQIRRIATSM